MLNEYEIWFKLHKGLGRSGLIADLGIECTMTLIALAHWIDANGQCYPTQQQVAEILGVTRKTTQIYLAKLIAFRNPDGKPILTKVTKRTPQGHKKDFYTFHPESFISWGQDKAMSPNGYQGLSPSISLHGYNKKNNNYKKNNLKEEQDTTVEDKNYKIDNGFLEEDKDFENILKKLGGLKSNN